jgi:hypothetical protein
MWYWRYVSDAGDGQARLLQRPDSGLSSGARASHEKFNVTQAKFRGPAANRFRYTLCSKGRTFTGTFEAQATRAAPCQHVPFSVCQ